MSSSPAEFFREYFQELERRGIPSVILHTHERLPETIESDIDYAVGDADLRRLPAIQAALAERLGWMVAQQLQHQVFAWYAVLVSRENPRHFLKLDACSHYVKDRCFLIRDELLLEGRRAGRGFFIPAPAAGFAYVLAKTFAKNKGAGATLPRLRELWEEDRAGAEERFAQLVGRNAGTFEDWLSRPASAWEALNARMRRRHRYTAALWLRELARMVRRARQPTGFALTLLGSDGVGKSAVLQRLRELLEPCFRRQLAFHFRPRFFERPGDGVPVAEPHAQAPRGAVSSALKLFFYLADAWLGWLVRIWPARTQSSLILFDRDLQDMPVDPRRYRLPEAGRLTRVIASLRPREDLTVVLDAAPEIIRARKAELPLEELARQRGERRVLAAHGSRHLLVCAERSLNEVAAEIARAVVERLAARTARRVQARRENIQEV